MSSGILQRGAIARAIADVLSRLASSAVGLGAALIGYKYGTVAAKFGEMVSVVDYGAKGDGSDDIAAVLRARADSGFIHFPRIGNAATTYLVGAFAAGALDGAKISAARGVTLSFANNAPYSLYKNIEFDTDVMVHFRDIGSNVVFPKTPSRYKKDCMPMVVAPANRTRTALDCTSARQVAARSVEWTTGDVFSIEPANRASDRITFPTGGGGLFRGAFVDIGPYETVSAFFDSGVAPGPIGVIVRGTNGYSVIYGTGGQSNFYTAQKPVGGALVGNHPDFTWAVLGQGAYASFQAENAVWSVTRIAAGRVIIKLNGKALTRPDLTGLGDVVEVGFCSFNAAPFSVSGLTVERRTDAIIGSQVLSEVRIFGDSTAEGFPGSWDAYLEQSMDGVAGLTLGTVSNYAVAGSTLEEAFAAMQLVGFGNAYHVIVCSGTNNIQGGQSLAAFKALVAQVCDYIIAAGRKPVLAIPWMWYTQAQAGGQGQASANYQMGAPYRMAMERIGYEKKCLVWKSVEELPNPDPAYLAGPDDPILRDNIHQSAYGNQLYARGLAQLMIDDYCALPDMVEANAAPDKFLNGASALIDFRYLVEKSGIGGFVGTLTVTTIATGTEIAELPRWCSPARNMNFVAYALSAGGAAGLGICYLAYDANTGRISIRNAPANTAVLVVCGATYKAA